MLILKKNRTIIVDIAFTVLLGTLGLIYGPITEILGQYSRDNKYNFFNIKDLNKFTCDQIDYNDGPPEIDILKIKKDTIGHKVIDKYVFIIDHTEVPDLDSSVLSIPIRRGKASILKNLPGSDSVSKILDSCELSDLLILAQIRKINEVREQSYSLSVLAMNGGPDPEPMVGHNWEAVNPKLIEEDKGKFNPIIYSVKNHKNTYKKDKKSQRSNFLSILNKIDSLYLQNKAEKNIKIIFLSDFYHEDSDGRDSVELEKLFRNLSQRENLSFSFIKYPIKSNVARAIRGYQIDNLIAKYFAGNFCDLRTYDQISDVDFCDAFNSFTAWTIFSNEYIEFYDMANSVGETRFQSSIHFRNEKGKGTMSYLLTICRSDLSIPNFEYKDESGEKKLPDMLKYNFPLRIQLEKDKVYTFHQNYKSNIDDGSVICSIYEPETNSRYFVKLIFRKKMPYGLAVFFLILTSIFINTIITTAFISFFNMSDFHNRFPIVNILIILMLAGITFFFLFVNSPFINLLSKHFSDIFIWYGLSLFLTFIFIYFYLTEKKANAVANTSQQP
jgi:hypothetical protein